MKGNLLIAHGGAPTAVINSSLYGAVTEAAKHEEIGSVYGAIGGSSGILSEKFFDFSTVSAADLELLKQTPASVIGTSRTPLEAEDYETMISILKKHNIRYVLFNGGNGSMDTCGKLYRAAKNHGITVVGIPKTIDNDIAITDHCPGYGSAARYLAQTVSEICQDVRSLPIHVCIIEAMGRNAGWITGAAAFAKEQGFGPHRIYLPEHAFDEEKFLSDVEALYRENGCAVIVASEGLKKSDGSPIVDPIFQTGRSVYFGDVGAHLAELVIKNLGFKARSEKPGIAGRASISCQSVTDRDEAVLAGAAACRAAVGDRTGVMIGFRRLSTEPYQMETMEIPIEEVMLHERPIPQEFLLPAGMGVTEEFVKWCRPLIGGPLPQFATYGRQGM